MAASREKAFCFAEYTLDLERGCLRCGVREIDLRPKSFALLRYLVENAGRLVPKEELMKALWPNIVVSDESLARCVSDVRHALKDVEQRLIKTAFRRSYLFAAPVTIEAPAGRAAAPSVTATEDIARALHDGEPALALPDKPSIAVLPFQNMSGDPEQEYFADGMVEEIITALSRIRWLFVIARNSTFTYKGQPIDVKRVGREVGVRYLLEGSVRKAGGRLRITAQLIDVGTSAHLWADHFDGSIEDVFDLQDKVAISVAGIIEPTLQAAETRRSAERPTSDLAAYDLYLRAMPHIVAHERREGVMAALDLLKLAVELDPNYGLALSLAALCRADLEIAGWTDDTRTNRGEAIELARRSLRCAGDDPTVLNRAAYALGELGEDIGAAVALADRSLELNPSFAGGWVNSGWLRLWAGDPDVAIKHFETGIRLNPRAPSGGASLGIGIAHFFARRFREAEAALLRSLQLMPGWVGPYRWLAACYAHMGRLDEARDVVRRLGAIAPCGRVTATRYRNAEHRELYLAGLRLAMDEAS